MPSNTAADRPSLVYFWLALLLTTTPPFIRTRFCSSYFSGWFGVRGVGVVGGHHEAAGEGGLQRLGPRAQRQRDAPQGVDQQRGIRALLGAAAHLLVVEHAQHVDVFEGFASSSARREA